MGLPVWFAPAVILNVPMRVVDLADPVAAADTAAALTTAVDAMSAAPVAMASRRYIFDFVIGSCLSVSVSLVLSDHVDRLRC